MYTRKIYGLDFNIYGISPYNTNIRGTHLRYDNRKEYPLNQYGKGPFCDFRIIDQLSDKGLYVFIVNGTVRYLGRCLNSFGKRINMGYGHISPRNCFLGGQTTNCHINWSINKSVSDGFTIEIGLCSLCDINLIKKLESEIIADDKALGTKTQLIWNRVNAPSE